MKEITLRIVLKPETIRILEELNATKEVYWYRRLEDPTGKIQTYAEIYSYSQYSLPDGKSYYEVPIVLHANPVNNENPPENAIFVSLREAPFTGDGRAYPHFEDDGKFALDSFWTREEIQKELKTKK